MTDMHKARGAKIQVTCENQNCGKGFEARVADRNRGWARYCSKSCCAVVKSINRQAEKVCT